MEKTAAAALEIAGLTLGYDGNEVLRDVDAVVTEGMYIAIVGPNGAGKSTLFKALAGLIPPLSGELRIFGRRSGYQAERIAYVPQREEIDWRFPVTVRDVVLMGRYGRLGWFRRPGREDDNICSRCLQQMGIADLERQPIGNLSGGQQQRVFLARALAQEPDIILLDEPFSGVDAPTREIVLQALDELHARGMTLLLSTHDLSLAAARCERVMLLNRRLVAFGPPSQVLTAEALKSTFGEQVLFYQDGERMLAVADDCCPEDIPKRDRRTRRERR